MTIFMSVAFCLKLAKSKALHPNLTFTVPYHLLYPMTLWSHVYFVLMYVRPYTTQNFV